MPHRFVLAVALLLFCVSACDDEESGPARLGGPVPESGAGAAMSDRLCHMWRTCGCDKIAGVSLSGCELGMSYSWQAISEEAGEQGLTYDGQCMAERLNAMMDRGCATMDTATGYYPGCGQVTCLIYHGDKGVGEDCEGSPSRSDCAQGLVCLGTCQEPCSNVPTLGKVGDACVDAEGRALPCEVGLLCDPDSQLCSSLPGDGAPCLASQCSQGHFCDFQDSEPTCRAQIQAGEGCTLPQQCASMICDGGTCAPAPSAGQSCQGVCSGELLCTMVDGARQCAALPELGQGCLDDYLHPCREGLACSDGTCVAPPGRGQACLLGSTTPCAEGLVCGGQLCSSNPSAPGCDSCDEPQGQCVVQVCTVEPPAVCADSGGVLY